MIFLTMLQFTFGNTPTINTVYVVHVSVKDFFLYLQDPNNILNKLAVNNYLNGYYFIAGYNTR